MEIIPIQNNKNESLRKFFAIDATVDLYEIVGTFLIFFE